MLLATMSCTDDRLYTLQIKIDRRLLHLTVLTLPQLSGVYPQTRRTAPKIETCLTAWLMNVHSLYPVHGFGMEQS